MKKKKFRGSKRHQDHHRPQHQAEVMPKVELGFFNAVPVVTREWESVHIILAGAGGNGSFFAPHAGRVMTALYAAGKASHLTICDPDRVGEENIGRQNFCRAELGQPKAEALMRRVGQAWGLPVTSFVGKYDESLIAGADLTILVGCVDRAEGRRALHQTLKHNDQMPGPPAVWWLDLGNVKDTGRVLFGSAYGYESLRGAFTSKGQCVALPSPALISPGLLKDAPEDLPNPNMSCAEMAAANLQSYMINPRLAAEAGDFLARLLVTHDLKRFAWEVHLASGNSRPTFTTPEEVARVIGKPVSHVLSPKPADGQFTAADLGAEEDLMEIGDDVELQDLIEAAMGATAAAEI